MPRYFVYLRVIYAFADSRLFDFHEGIAAAVMPCQRYAASFAAFATLITLVSLPLPCHTDATLLMPRLPFQRLPPCRR